MTNVNSRGSQGVWSEWSKGEARTSDVPFRILVLYWDNNPERMRLAIRQHLHAMEAGRTRHRVIYWNMFYGNPSWGRMVVPHADAILLHTTLLCNRWNEPGYFQGLKDRMRWLRDVDCVKIALPQDEYDHAELLDEWLFELEVPCVFSNFEEAQRVAFYRAMADKAGFYKCLTGYIDQDLASEYESRLHPLGTRSYDIVYRATRLPYWFGKHGQLKHRIAEVFAERAAAHGLSCDISTREEDTIVGVRWLEFLASGRAVIGCESGSSVLDLRGTVRARIKKICEDHPGISFEKVSSQMPEGWDEHAFFALSPRHLEAVVTKTCQILVEGYYDGVLVPGKHYIPLKPDFSNIDEVLEQLQDRDRVSEITERAYRDICVSGRYSYRAFAAALETAIQRARAERSERSRSSWCDRDELFWTVGSAGSRLSAWRQRLRRKMAPFVEAMERFGWAVDLYLSRLAKGAIALAVIMPDPVLRAMLIRFLGHERLRSRVTLPQVLEDLLKLRLLLQARAGEIQGWSNISIEVSFNVGQGLLLFQSRPCVGFPGDNSNGVAVGDIALLQHDSGSLKKVIWDHSVFGNRVLYPILGSKGLTISLGAKGVYEFLALEVFAGYFPEQMWLAFSLSNRG